MIIRLKLYHCVEHFWSAKGLFYSDLFVFKEFKLVLRCIFDLIFMHDDVLTSVSYTMVHKNLNFEQSYSYIHYQLTHPLPYERKVYA